MYKPLRAYISYLRNKNAIITIIILIYQLEA